MFRKLKREMFLLSRGEQRALVVATFLLLVSLGVRIVVQFLPGPEPAGVEVFEKDARTIMALLATADSLEQARSDPTETRRSSLYNKRFSPEVKPAQERPSSRIDINRADSVQLLPLPGIGPVFAGRIIKYRDLLGGFVRVDQLGEVYGLPMETVDRIRDRVLVDTSAIRKIHLDSAGFRELLRHPYLQYKDVRALVEYREFKGEIGSANELTDNQILPDTTLIKMDAYFDYR